MMAIALECAFLYIDDIIVIGCTKAYHVKNLKEVFKKLKSCDLKLDPEKRNFFCADVTFFGHHVSAEGIQPDKSTYTAVENYPIPRNTDEVHEYHNSQILTNLSFCVQTRPK